MSAPTPKKAVIVYEYEIGGGWDLAALEAALVHLRDRVWSAPGSADVRPSRVHVATTATAEAVLALLDQGVEP